MRRAEMIAALDVAVDALDNANLRGFATRCSGSKFYRRSPLGCTDSDPSDDVLALALVAARIELRRKEQKS